MQGQKGGKRPAAGKSEAGWSGALRLLSEYVEMKKELFTIRFSKSILGKEQISGGILMKDGTTKAVVCAALGNIIWGFSFLFTKVALARVPDPKVMLAHRFIISAVLMLLPVLAGRVKVRFRGKDLRYIGAMVVLQLCYYLFETYGILYTNTTVSGLVLALVPVVTIGTGALFLKEYPTRRQALFCLMPVAGVILMTVSGRELGVITALGALFLALTLLASALFKTVNRKAAEQFTAYERTCLVMSCSAVVFTVTGLGKVGWRVSEFVTPLLNVPYVCSVLSLCLLCSIAANLMVNYASGKMSVFKVSSFGALSTLCSTVAGVVVLKEPWSWPLLLGAVLILVGIRQVTQPK